LVECVNVVKFVVSGVVLGREATGVSTAGVRLMLTVETPADRWAIDTDGLVVGNIGGKSADFVEDVKLREGLDKRLQIVGPSEPSTVGGVNVDGDVGHRGDGVDSVGNTHAVGGGGGTVTALRISLVGGKVRE